MTYINLILDWLLVIQMAADRESGAQSSSEEEVKEKKEDKN